MISQAENQTGLAGPNAGPVNMLRFQNLVAAGGILGALAASSCCILPLVLFGLGVSGAWIGNLTWLAPYQPYFIAAVTNSVGALVPVPGGVLVKDADGTLLGAVGVSGDTSDNDEAAAVAGIDAAGLTAETG